MLFYSFGSMHFQAKKFCSNSMEQPYDGYLQLKNGGLGGLH